jgi:transglutaminase-like putative cysteine protease
MGTAVMKQYPLDERTRHLLITEFFLAQALMLIALTGLVTEGIDSSLTLKLLIGWIAIGTLRPKLLGSMPRTGGRWVGAAIIIFLIVDLGLHFSDPIDPLLRLGYLIFLSRNLSYRTNRESLQIILLSLFIVILCGVLSVSITYLIQLLLFLPIALVLLTIGSIRTYSEQEVLSHDEWDRFRLSGFLNAIRQSLSLKHVWALMGMLVFMTSCIATIFITLPRIQIHQIIPNITIAGKAKTGFSESFELGSVAAIMEDYSPAFRVEVSDRTSFPEKPFWRMLTMDTYEKGRWSTSQRNANGLRPLIQFKAIHALATRMFPENQQYPDNTWTVYMEGSVSRYLPIPGSFRSIEFVATELLSIDLAQTTFRLGQTPSNLFSFKLKGVLPDTSFRDSAIDAWFSHDHHLEGREPVYPYTTRILNLSAADDETLQSIVAQIRQNQSSSDAVGFAVAAIQYLRENHRYSLQPYQPQFRGDPVVAWLDVGAPGHCEYFATGLALLARKAGYPSRVCVGFAGGKWNERGDLFTVRHRDAHTWCEIRDEKNGWIRVDPTPPARDTWQDGYGNGYSFFEFAGAFEWIEDLKVQYYRNVIGFGSETQNQLLLGLNHSLERWTGRLFSGFSGLKDNRNSGSEGSASAPSHRFSFGWNWSYLLVIMLGAAIYLQFQFRFTGSPIEKTRLKARRLLRKNKAILEKHPGLLRELRIIAYGRDSDWNHPNNVLRSASKINTTSKQRKIS